LRDLIFPAITLLLSTQLMLLAIFMKFSLAFLLLSLAIACNNIYAQSKTIDSLTAAIENAPESLQKAKLLFQRSKAWPNSMAERSIGDAQQALPYFQQAGDKVLITEAYLQMAFGYSRQERFKEALALDDEAYDVAQSINYVKGMAIALSHKARNYIAGRNRPLAEKYYLASISLLKKAGLERESIPSYNGLGIIYRQNGQLQRSISYLDTTIQLSTKYKNTPALAQAYMNKANTFTLLANYEEALKLHHQSLEIKEKLKDQLGILQSYNNMANTLKMMNQYQESIGYYQKAIVLAKKLKINTSLGNNYSNLAVTYIQAKKSLDSVPYFFEQAIATFKKIGDKSGEALAMHNYGNFLTDNDKDQDRAENYLKQALAIRTSLNAKHDMASSMSSLGALYSKTARRNDAEKMLLQSLKLLKTENSNKKKETFLRLAAHYKSTGDFEEAYKYQAEYAALKDTLLTENEVVNALKAQGKYEIQTRNTALALAHKNKELAELKMAKQNQQMVWLGLALVLTLILLGLLYVIYKNNKRYVAELSVKKGQIETLIKELHHRVKNNLQVISSLLSLQGSKIDDANAKSALEEGKSRVDAMAMIHQKLYSEEQMGAIDMQEYLQQLSASLADSYGYDTKVVSTIVDIPQKAMDLEMAIPLGLIVNELISNSFKHAFKAQPEPKIELKLIKLANNNTQLTIKDNGTGSDVLQDTKTDSFGLRLIKTLVRQLEGNMDVSNGNGTAYTINFVS
jgi:two-component sensor histidine kinase